MMAGTGGRQARPSDAQRIDVVATDPTPASGKGRQVRPPRVGRPRVRRAVVRPDEGKR